ncbi:MAG TPA: ribonuclease H-like domain-containing protein [Polyangiaceae bacterium]|jgi:hypothetical protein
MSLHGRLARLTAAPTAREALLDDLRSRMRRVLERTAVARPPPTVSAEDTEHRLPFFAEETAAGLLHRRVLRLSAAHRTGRAPAYAAKDVDCTLLSLLALDPTLAKIDFARALYLDTETTGLSGGTGTVAFLVGLATFDEHGLFVEQILVRRLGEEAPMLAHVRERIEAASALVTFNGKTFDMPLLRTRFLMSRMPPPSDKPHLDLLHVARRLHGRGNRLTMLEEKVLGYLREGDVPSGEVSERYLHFLRTGQESALLGVVEHNAQDVISMIALVGLYGESLQSSALAPADLVGVARTLKRARALDRAFDAATLASDRGAGPDALRARAAIARARGDRDRALADLEALLAEVDDPAARLDLAKLYEHHVKDAGTALDLVAAGVAETDGALEKRRARLARKAERQKRARLFVPKG